MKKLMISVCAFSLFVCQIFYVPVAVGQSNPRTVSASSANATTSSVMSTGSNNTKTPKSKSGADTSGLGSEYAPNAGDKAANWDAGLTAVTAIIQALSILGKLFQWAKQNILPVLEYLLTSWVPVWFPGDLFGAFMTLAHGAVTKRLRDETKITASFAGAEGWVTDKWVGPAARNKTIKVVGDIHDIEGKRFDTLKYDPDEYEGLSETNKNNPTPIELMKYREQTLIEDQRNLSNVQTQNWNLLYRSQQRSIKAMAGAMNLKKQLRVLAGADDIVSAGYSTQPDALNTLAARRALHDSLMLLKMQVVAARVKIRANAMELEFKPLQKESEKLETATSGTKPGYHAGNTSGRD